MPTTYTPNASNDPATYTLPSDLDNATAESVNAVLRSIADKAHHAYQVFAQLAAANTLTARNTYSITDAAEPSVLTSVMASDDANVGNKWKCFRRHRVASSPANSYVREWFGITGGSGEAIYAITLNSYWVPASAHWEQDTSSYGSFALMLHSSIGTITSYVAAGAGTWSAWPTSTPISFGGLKTPGPVSAGDFTFVQDKQRMLNLSAPSARGGGVVDSGSGNLSLNDLGYCWWRIQLPHGSTLGNMEIKHYQSGASGCTFQLYIKDALWGSPSSAPSLTPGTSVTANSTIGYKVTTLSSSGITIDNAYERFLVWKPIDTLNQFVSARLPWFDRGPGRDY
jgi:hypothetical protein